MKRIRHILYASDFSSASSRAFTTAVTLAKTNQATLTILHVVEPPIQLVPDQYIDAATLNRLEAQARHWSQRHLDRLAKRAAAAGVRAVTRLRRGDPREEIVRAARSERAGVMVVGTHGRTGFSKLLLGSVAERVIRNAPCPVVTVRGR